MMMGVRSSENREGSEFLDRYLAYSIKFSGAVGIWYGNFIKTTQLAWDKEKSEGQAAE